VISGDGNHPSHKLLTKVHALQRANINKYLKILVIPQHVLSSCAAAVQIYESLTKSTKSACTENGKC